MNSTPVSAVSSANNFYFSDFDASYYIWRDEDGLSRLRVTENLTAVFPTYSQNHGITRVIPFTNNDGQNLTMTSDSNLKISVERNGMREPIDHIETGDGYFMVYIGDSDEYITGEQKYTLTYEFENVVLDQEMGATKWQELYWDTNGNDWSQRFENLTARVYFDEEIADDFNNEIACYVGSYGVAGSERCHIQQLNDEITLDSTHHSTRGIEFTAQNLRAGENLTFVLGFDADTFTLRVTPADYRYVVTIVIISIAGLVMIYLMIRLHLSTAEKRKYYKNLFVKPEYTPFTGLTVAEMAKNYIGKGLKGDAKVATLLELAVQHKIALVKTEKDGLLGKKKTIWRIRLLTDQFNTQQASVLKILTGKDATLELNQEIDVKNRTGNSTMARLVQRFDKHVEQRLIAKEMIIDPSKKSADKNWSSTLGVAMVAWLIVGIFAAVFLFTDVPPYRNIVGADILPAIYGLILGGIFTIALIAVIRNDRFATHTMRGLEVSKYLEGLKLYMEMAEAERLQMLQSVKGADTTHEGVVKLYEKLLPYAMLFGLEESWLKELSRYYEFDDVATPTWYAGIGVFSARDFNAAMLAASHSMSSAIAHSTTSNSSSSSSGFSGGFSGGGGGGGGGGGW